LVQEDAAKQAGNPVKFLGFLFTVTCCEYM